jgi:hypothetical protein
LVSRVPVPCRYTPMFRRGIVSPSSGLKYTFYSLRVRRFFRACLQTAMPHPHQQVPNFLHCPDAVNTPNFHKHQHTGSTRASAAKRDISCATWRGLQCLINDKQARQGELFCSNMQLFVTNPAVCVCVCVSEANVR